MGSGEAVVHGLQDHELRTVAGRGSGIDRVLQGDELVGRAVHEQPGDVNAASGLGQGADPPRVFLELEVPGTGELVQHGVAGARCPKCRRMKCST